MAAYVSITQGRVFEGGNSANSPRRESITWNFVNTSLEDETHIIEDGFFHLLKHEDLIRENAHMYKNFVVVVDRFFYDGMFLYAEQLEMIQELLVFVGESKLQIPNNGKYFQPVLPGKKSPCKKSWIANGESRQKQMKKFNQMFKEKVLKREASDLSAFFH